MKPYFAKYLPVEGKVEIGDYFIDTGVMSDGTLVGQRRNKEGVYDYQKVKLFLCSRDIQVGDNVWDSHNGHYKADQMLVDLLTGPAIAALKEVPVKVIGEISPEAIFVKENDEFEEEDLNYFMRGVNNSYSVTKQTFEFSPSSYIIKIKGPCGHFH